MPVLQRLMRHESIQTTMKYYVDMDLGMLTDVLDEAVGDKKGDMPVPPKHVWMPGS